VELLKGHCVERLVDVRSHPRSRHTPQFAREHLSSAVARSGIHYSHMPGWAAAATRGADHGPALHRAVRRTDAAHASDSH
jgi:uncharacterized protein (DUF488 family)